MIIINVKKLKRRNETSSTRETDKGKITISSNQEKNKDTQGR